MAKLVFICDRLLCSVDLFFTGPTPLVGLLSGGLVGQEPDVQSFKSQRGKISGQSYLST